MSATPEPIAMLDMSGDVQQHWYEYEEAFRRVIRSGRFIRGREVAAFEQEVASYLGCSHAIGVNSGTDALVIGLRALGVGPGDEVITTPFTFAATPESICLVGAKPVFVDVDRNTFNIDPNLIESAITKRTKAILPVHLFGLPADMPRICEIARRHNLRIIEDTAQAFGAVSMGKKAGTIGDIGAFSFFPSKNLGGFGDGGLIATDDDSLAELARTLSTHGARVKYQNELLGYNSRLDELQAALLRVRLPRVDEHNTRRRRIAEIYANALKGVPGITAPAFGSHPEHVYHQFAIRLLRSDRDRLAEGLLSRHISTAVYYSVPCHRLAPYANAGRRSSPRLARADELAKQVLCLPIGPCMDVRNACRVSECVVEGLAFDQSQPANGRAV